MAIILAHFFCANGGTSKKISETPIQEKDWVTQRHTLICIMQGSAPKTLIGNSCVIYGLSMISSCKQMVLSLEMDPFPFCFLSANPLENAGFGRPDFSADSDGILGGLTPEIKMT